MLSKPPALRASGARSSRAAASGCAPRTCSCSPPRSRSTRRARSTGSSALRHVPLSLEALAHDNFGGSEAARRPPRRARAPRRALRRARAAEGLRKCDTSHLGFSSTHARNRVAPASSAARRTGHPEYSAASSSNLPTRPPARFTIARGSRPQPRWRCRLRAGGRATRRAALALVPLVAARGRRRAGARRELRVHHADGLRVQRRGHRDRRVDRNMNKRADAAGRDANQSRREVEQMRAAEEGAAVGRPRAGASRRAGRAAGPAASTCAAGAARLDQRGDAKFQRAPVSDAKRGSPTCWRRRWRRRRPSSASSSRPVWSRISRRSCACATAGPTG